MTYAYLDHGDYNVLAVDWGGGSAALYSQAAANTRLVALEVAAVIEAIMVWWIKKRKIICPDLTNKNILQRTYSNYPASNFHIIGHSLGSHIAGYVGETLQHR